MIPTISTSARLRRLVATLLAALLLLSGASPIYAVGPSDTITTVAGNGTLGYAGDGRLAVTSGQLLAAPTSPSSWVFQGPAPALKGQQSLINVTQANGPVSGAIGGGPYSDDFGLIAASPTDPNTIYVGSDGGIWKTTNATAASPTWTPLIDSMPSVNVRALSADPTDTTFQTVLAGSDRAGLYYTTNGGTSWAQIVNTLLVPSGYKGGYQAVAARGSTLLAANGNGLFRTTGGSTGTWSKISGTGGLPAAAASDLVGDPADPNRLYVTFTGASGGIFRSDDLGATWTNVTSGITVISSGTNFLHVAVFNDGVTSAVDVVLNGTVKAAVFQSVNGAAFTALDVPPIPSSAGLSEIGADKTNPNLVYLSGYGTTDVFRVDASKASGTQVTNIAAGGSYGYPHADYTAFRFDANGSLLAGSHGGIYRLSAPGSPASATNYWVPIMGNIGAFYFYNNQIAYDHISHVILGQAQDNGDVYQTAQGSQIWTHAIFGDGDGTPVMVDSATLAASGQSIRYQGRTRFVFDATNKEVSRTDFSTSMINDGYAYVTPNTIDPRRILFGGGSLYESLDMGNAITRIADRGVGSSIAYGGYRNGVANPDVLYFGNGYYIYSRTTAGGPVTQLPLPPAGSGFVRAVVMDPNDWMTVYIGDHLGQVYKSTNGGTTWSNITGNLQSGAGIYGSNNSINVVPGAAGYLVVGSENGVYSTPLASPGTWSRMGTNLPKVYVGSTVFDTTDDVLVIGTIGRGAYLLPNASKEFNSAPTVALSPATPVAEGDTASYSFTVTDPNPGDTFTVDSLTVSSGGSLVPGSRVTTPTGGSFRVSYPDGPASPTISLVVKDSYGAPSNTATANVTVNNVAPTAIILGAPTRGPAGKVINLSSAVTDPSVADTTAGFSLNWLVLKNGIANGVGIGTSFSFTPDATATYQVELAATDRNGARSNTSKTINVTAGSPSITASSASVTVNEGQVATNSGTFASLNGNPVTLSASVGTLTVGPTPIHVFRGDGNANDSVTGGAPGTINGGITFTPGQVGTAFNFPGSGGVPSTTPNVEYPAADFAPGTSDFSVAFGMKTSVSAVQTVLGNRSNASHDNFFYFTTRNGKLNVELDQDTSGTNYVALTTSTNIADGNFHLVTVTRSGTTVKLYIDGVLNVTGSSAGTTNLNSGKTFRLGAQQGPIASYVAAFAGLLDEVRIYNGALSPTAIAQDYSAFVAGTSLPAIYGTWSWTSTTNDGPAQSQDVTITATNTVNSEVTSISFPLVVKNALPSATFSNGGAVSEGSTGTVSFSGQSDPSTADTAAGFRYAYDFDNDGVFEVGDGTYAGSSTATSATVPASFLADGPGARTVRGWIIDKDGGFIDYTTVITTNNAAPTASVSGLAAALAGQIVTFVVGAADTSPVDQAAGFTYSVNWGDGSPVETISRLAGNRAAPAIHAFAATGSYNVQVTATDKNGAASVAPASMTVTVSDMSAANLQTLIGTTPIINLSAPNNTIAQTMVTAVNGLTSPTTPVKITIVLGAGTYTGVTASPKANITLILAGTSGTVINGASPALTVTEGEVFAQDLTLTNDTDAPTILVTGGHATLGEANIQESTGFNNVALEVTGGTVSLDEGVSMNVNGRGSFVRTYDLEAVSPPEENDAFLTPNLYSVNGVPINATSLSATSLSSSAATSFFGQPVVFTATIDVGADALVPATGTVTFYDGAAVLGTGTVSKVGGQFVTTFTATSLSAGTHTIVAVYGGNDMYVASSAVLTQLVVAYPFTGFFSPVDNPPTLNKVNSGRSIRFKFSLGGDRGLNIIAAGYPVSQRITCDTHTPLGIEKPTTPRRGLTYNPTTGRYRYVWKTQKSWAGTCRQFTLRLIDGTDHIALFKFKSDDTDDIALPSRWE